MKTPPIGSRAIQENVWTRDELTKSEAKLRAYLFIVKRDRPTGTPLEDARVINCVEKLDKYCFMGSNQFIELARSVNLSPSRLRHLIKRDLGMSPGQYLKVCRLCLAQRLLESSFMSVKEIANSVGLSDVSHFVRDFKKVYGARPTQYRKELRGAAKSANEEPSEPISIT
jgi:AraC-like DNA-binding protein